jgi:plastocyanin
MVYIPTQFKIMKRILTLALLWFFCQSMSAQLVISEIFYNSPDGSPDSLEFIEIYNNEFFDISLSGYQMTSGVVFQFPDITLAAGAYFIVTNDSLTLQVLLGVEGHEWPASQNLSNNGESIVIKDQFGFTIDSLTYDEVAPWPEPADGNGFSMELCDLSSDNSLASNWFKSENITSATINNVALKCTPGVANSVCSPYINQLIITEIMYNLPGSDAPDSLEYIELYNAGEEPIFLDGLQVIEGFQFVFPDEELDPGDYLLLAYNPTALRNKFNIPNNVSIWAYDSGELSNSLLEDIVLIDANGLLVDEVIYDVDLPYNPLADGDGYSLELCDYSTDNLLPLNWKLSSTYADLVISNKTIFCTPGKANSPCPQPDHVVILNDDLSFNPETIMIFAGQTVEWQLNSTGVHNINGLQSLFNTNLESFYSGVPVAGPWNFSHTFKFVGTNTYRCDNFFQQGMTGTVIVQPAPYEDIVITEILYHQPGGDDNYDFVEFYNRSAELIELGDYFFAQGVEYEFPNIPIGPGQYLVVTKDADAFFDAFGVNAFQWTSGGLNNNGETITLSDGVQLIDFITFDDDAPWPEISDGEGASMMLCDFESDNNNPINWLFSTTQTSVATAVNPNLYIHATPGAPNDSCSVLPSIFFGEDIPVFVKEGVLPGDSIVVKFKMANLGTSETAYVDVIVETSSTATNGIGNDFHLTETTIDFTPEAFGTTSNGRLTIFINDDSEQEFTEQIIIRLQNPVNANLATVGTATIDIIDNDGFNPNLYPEMEIGDVTINDNNGLNEANGTVAALRGIVYGYNLHPDGVEFTLIDKDDKEDGIRVFKNNNAPAYTVTEGDEISVYGYISQFDGLSKIIPDHIELHSQQNPLFAADTIVSGALSEEEKSKLIVIKGCVTWSNNQNVGPARHYIVTSQITNQSYLMRVDDDTDVPPTINLPEAFHLTGIGSQIDPASPYNAGYMIMPRFAADLSSEGCIVSTNKELEQLKVVVFPNPANDHLTIYSDLDLEQLVVYNMLGQMVMTRQVTQSENRLNISILKPGTYMLTCIHQDKMKTMKFVKL